MSPSSSRRRPLRTAASAEVERTAQEEEEVEKGKEGFLLRRDEPTTTLTTLVAESAAFAEGIAIFDEGRPTAIAAACARAPRSARAGLTAAGLGVKEEATAFILRSFRRTGKRILVKNRMQRERERRGSLHRFSAPGPRLLGLEWPPLTLRLEVEGEDRLVRENRGESERWRRKEETQRAWIQAEDSEDALLCF